MHQHIHAVHQRGRAAVGEERRGRGGAHLEPSRLLREQVAEDNRQEAVDALMAVAGPVLSLEFFPWALSMEVVTFVLFLCYYVVQKLQSNERIPNWLVVMVASNLALWFVAFRLYAVKVLDYRLTPKQSEAMNEPCVLWNFFDVHDCWHFVSSAALFLHQLIMFLIDSDLSQVPRRDIAAF